MTLKRSELRANFGKDNGMGLVVLKSQISPLGYTFLKLKKITFQLSYKTKCT